MDHGANKCVKKQSHTETTAKTEVAEAALSSAYVDIEIDVNHLKEESGLAQFVKPQPALFVKEEILEHSSEDGNEQQCVHSILTPAGTGSANEACSTSLGDLLNVKHETKDIDIRPTMLQPMDTHYAINKHTSKQTTTVDDYNKPMPSIEVETESVADNLKDRKNRNYHCDKCSKTFQFKCRLKSHCQIVHETQYYKCLKCNRKFKCMTNLRNHINTVHQSHNNQRYECDICKKIFKYKKNIRHHIMGYHSHLVSDRKNRNYHCDKCSKTFLFKSGLKSHCQIMHETEYYKCPKCKREFKCMRYLQNHINNTHSNRQYECDICKKIFNYKHNISRHIKKCHSHLVSDIAGKQHQHYGCDKCLKTFKSKYVRNHHCNSIHGTESHKCTQCKKEFKCKSYLERHVRHTHNKEKYECDICKRMCSTLGALRYHVRHIHSKEKNECDICKKTFAVPEVLRRHVRYVHSKEKYECDICEKTFSSPGVLRLHVSRIHHNRSTVTSTRAILGSTSVAADSAERVQLLHIKEELEDIDIGPTVLQHMDSHYRNYQVKVEKSPLTNAQSVKNEPDLSMQEDITGA